MISRARSRAGTAAIATAAALSSLFTPGAATAGPLENLFPGSRFCDQQSQYRGTRAVADGPISQLVAHESVFGPAYASVCPSGSGLVTYLGTEERAGVDAAIDHIATINLPTGNVPLSTDEKLLAEQDQRSEQNQGRVSPIHQIPLYVDALALGYNLACARGPLRLRNVVLGLIFAGRITTWNDDLILNDNQASLAGCGGAPIRLVKRSDLAGTTAVLKDYLAKGNPFWQVYRARPSTWPTTAAACKAVTDDGMASCIVSLSGSIGYLQYHMANARRIAVALVDSTTRAVSADAAERFTGPSAAGCTAAATTTVLPPYIPQPPGALFAQFGPRAPTRADWSLQTLTDAPTGYPICWYAFGFVYERHPAAYAGSSYPFTALRTVVDYLWTALGDSAQANLARFGLGRLPPNVRVGAQQGLETVRWSPYWQSLP